MEPQEPSPQSLGVMNPQSQDWNVNHFENTYHSFMQSSTSKTYHHPFHIAFNAVTSVPSWSVGIWENNFTTLWKETE